MQFHLKLYWKCNLSQKSRYSEIRDGGIYDVLWRHMKSKPKNKKYILLAQFTLY